MIDLSQLACQINMTAGDQLLAVRDGSRRITLRWMDGTPAARINLSPTRLTIRGERFRTVHFNPEEKKCGVEDWAATLLFDLFEHADDWWDQTKGECSESLSNIILDLRQTGRIPR